MFNRRDFIRTLATGGTLFALSPATAFPLTGERSANAGFPFNQPIHNNPYQLPLWKDVDVIVVGATSGGIAAAIAAAQAGARVFVISSFPYMGEDICGSFMYWPKELQSHSSLFKKIFPGAVPPYPLHVKSVMENELISHQIEFLYNSFVSNTITDDQGELSGICIGNRSGYQAIRCKVIIDATHHAVIARLAGIPFHPFKPGQYRFRFVTVGSKEKKDPSIIYSREIHPAFNVNNKSLTAWEYILDISLKDESFDTLMEAEQKIRDLTWDTDLGDSADIPYYISSSYMKSKDPFEPDGISNLFVLGPSSAVERNRIAEYMEPARYMEYGEEVGKKAAERSFTKRVSDKLCITPIEKTGIHTGEISLQSPFRPFTPFTQVYYKGGGIPVLGEYDVVIAGGGTAGAPAAIGAARKGVRTLLLEHLHGLGGIGTYGHIGRYTAGYRQGFTAETDQAMQAIADPDHPRHIKKDSSEWPLDWKAEWYRQQIRKAGGHIWFHTIVSGVFKNGNQIEGVIVNTPLGQGLIRCKRVIDSTGSADIAIAAGAQYEYTGKNSLAIQGAGLAKFNPHDHYNNTDWTFVDDTDITDVTRLFIQGKIKNQGNYDVGKLPQTRERRRVIAEYNVSVFDMINKRTYKDTISYHRSNFDTHGFTEDIFFTIKPPAHSGITYEVKLPLRSLLPAGFENILVTGLGCGAHRDAMPVIRMQPDLQNQGYAAGVIAAESVLQGLTIRETDIRNIQRELIQKGNLPAEVLQENDTYPITTKEMEHAVKQLSDNYSGLENVLAFPKKAIPLLTKWYKKAPAHEKLYYANVLCMLNTSVGWETILDKVKTYPDWDKGWNYRGMHQFGFSISELDNYVMALGLSKRKEVVPELLRLAEKLNKISEFSHIRAISVAFENYRSDDINKAIYRLLQLKGMTGYHLADQYEATQKIKLNIIDRVYVLEDSMRNQSLKELYLAKALYSCGDQNGLGEQILQNYANGLEGHYARFAWETLNKTTN